MAIAAGDEIPDVELRVKNAEGKIDPVSSRDVLGKGKVVLFAVPGAFTPTCSSQHLPGFVIRADELRAKGVDTVACVSVNDAHVMHAWGEAQGVGDKVLMLADGGAEFTTAMGLESDGNKSSMGIRSKRYAVIIEDGVVKTVAVETAPGLNVSSAEAILQAL